MSKSIETQGQNKVNIVGKLLDINVRSGKFSDGRDYESANFTIRVNQTYHGRDEVSEIPVSMLASKYTKAGGINPGWTQLQDFKNLKTAQMYGFDDAAVVRINSASLRENNFVSRTGQLINTWQISTSFAGQATAIANVASFVMDIFILDMKPEEDRNGDTTGRLIVKGGVVQYGQTLDIFNFIVEQPDDVDFIERNWNVNDTVTIQGRIRVTSTEEKSSGMNSSWGEDIPETTVRTVRELIITKGDDQGKEEEFAYDTADIKKLFNARKAKIEQMQLDTQNKTKSAPASAATTPSKYSWE